MNKILLLNNSKTMVSFDVSYYLSTSKEVKEIKSSPFLNEIFRIIDIPKNAVNIIITIYKVDSKGKKQIIRQEKQEKSFNICYEASESFGKIEAKTTACQKFNGAYSIYGVNKSSYIVRAQILYILNGETHIFVSDPIKKELAFSFLTPLNAKKVKIKMEKAIDISKDVWSHFYLDSLSENNTPMQKCYVITKPLFKDIKCSTIDCLKFL